VASAREDRDRLIEALAIPLGFASTAAFAEVRSASREPTVGLSRRSIAEILVERGLLTAERAAILEMLADDLLARHDGDLRRCLDSLDAFGRLRPELENEHPLAESRTPTLPSRSGPRTARPLAPSGETNGTAQSPSGAAEPVAKIAAEDDEEAEFGWSLTGAVKTGGRFQVLHAHARGGIGLVSVAFDAELKREVALKQIKPESADDPDSRSRFLLEAEVTGRLEHPGIVPVYGLGYDEQGHPYYAMRFVRGITLEEAIDRFHRADAPRDRDPRERALELRRLLGQFINVCHTMAYAHSRGVLHRDLKPANVLLGPYNETLVVDWGLAKVLSGREEEAEAEESAPMAKPPRPSRIVPALGSSSSTETIAGSAFGTPAFMSPEQAAGELHRLSPASDVYSLGAMLYTLLAGRPPFESAWCEVTELLAQVRNGQFPTPRQVNPRVPRPLEAVCLKALATRREDRYRSADELATEIERWLADEPVSAYREPLSARLGRWARRHRPLVTGAAALLITAVAGLSIGLVLLGRAQRETESQRLRAVREREIATFMTDEALRRADTLRRRDYINRLNLAYREFLDDNVALADQLLYGCPSELRNWEWSYVHRLGHPELETLVTVDPTQALDIWSLSFSPDGRQLLSGSGPWFLPQSAATGSLILRELESGRDVFAVRGQPGAVQAVAFRPDGRQVVAAAGTSGAASSSLLTVYDAATGQPLWQVSEPGVNILSVAYAPDGQTLATGCGGFNSYGGIGFLRLRDATTGESIRQLPGGPGGVASLAFSPDGSQLAAANRGLVDVWKVAEGTLAFRLAGHVGFVYAVAFSPDGRWIASGGWDRTIRLWDRNSGRLQRTMLGHKGFVRGLVFGPDGRLLLSGGEDKSVRLWEVDSGRELASFHGHSGFVHCVAFSPDGMVAASGGQDGTVKLWPAAAPDPQVTFRNGSGWVGSLAVHPAGDRVATAHDGSIRVWDPRTGEELWMGIAPRGLLGRIALAFTPDGETLVASGPEGKLRLWDAKTGALKASLANGPSRIEASALSPDGSLLAAVTADVVTLIELPSGIVVRTLSGHAAAINAVAFAPDGRLATASEDRTVKVWNLATGAVLATLSGHETGVKNLAFSPDGRLLASVGGQYRGSPAAEVMLWESDSGELIRWFHGHTSLVTSVAFFPDGRRLATGSDDRTLKLWDPATGDDVFTLRGHTSGVVSLAISRDGRQIVSGSIDYTARVWSAEPPITDLALVRRRAAVNLVQARFATQMVKSEVLGSLRSEPTLNEPLRSAALEIAARRGEDAQGLAEAAWLVVVHPTDRPELIEPAVRQLEAACSLVSDDPPRERECRIVLSLAYHRSGQPARALELLDRAEADSPTSVPLASVALAVRAMASYELGQTDAARAALNRLSLLATNAPGPVDPLAEAFFSEAKSRILLGEAARHHP
jgi:WD40 repeat protein/serine/threonine protein kinase